MKRRDFLKGMLGASMAALAPATLARVGASEAKPKPGSVIPVDRPITKLEELPTTAGIREEISWIENKQRYLVNHVFYVNGQEWNAPSYMDDMEYLLAVREEHAKAIAWRIDHETT